MTAKKQKGPITREFVSEFIEESGDDGGFLATYADMVTLLLAFFVMLYGMSDTDASKFSGAAASLRSALVGALDGPITAAPPAETPSGPELATAPIEELMKTLQSQLPADQVELEWDGTRIRLRVRNHLLFKSGSSDLAHGAEALFAELGGIIKTKTAKSGPVRVAIEGHTDDKPISTPKFPSNWELSAIRATTVLRQLTAQGLPTRHLTATGYGDRLPLGPNDNRENRAKNRRVELVLEMETQE